MLVGVMVISNRVSALLKGPLRSAWELPRRVGGEGWTGVQPGSQREAAGLAWTRVMSGVRGPASATGEPAERRGAGPLGAAAVGGGLGARGARPAMMPGRAVAA